MKAILQRGYGTEEVLSLGDVPKPTPRAGEVLVRVHAASMHPDVWHVVAGLPYVLRLMGAGFRKPKNPTPGTDLAGVVEEIGTGVTRFRPGDEVFGETIVGMQWINGGAFAESAVAPEASLVHKPQNVSFEQAAAVPTAGLIATACLHSAGALKAGSRVLVNGAGGGVGTLALQLLKAGGAQVTVVDSADKLAVLRSLGADETIDYQKDDFVQRSERYSLLLDIPTNRPFSVLRRVLEPDGVYVPVGHDHYGKGMARWFGLIPWMLGLMLQALFTRQLPRPSFALPDKTRSLEALRDLLENGKLTPHVDRTFALAEVPEALRYLKTGRAIGKVVIRVAE